MLLEDNNAQEAFLDVVLSNMPGYFFVKDKNYVIVNANDAFLSLYPEDQRDKVIGYTTLEKYDKEEADLFLEMDRLAFETGYSETIEKIAFPDGKIRVLKTQKKRFHDADGEPFIIGFATDITALDEKEADLRAANLRLEEADKAKDVFVSNMAHEIRTPLAGVVSALDLIERDASSDKMQRHVSMANQCAATLETIIGSVLDLSKIQSGTIQIAAEPFNPVELLGNIASAVSTAIDDAGLALKLDYAGLEDRWYLGDAPRLAQVLFNLLSNARKYTRSGTVTLKAWAEDKADTTRLCFEVQDTGAGIPPDRLDSLFDRFEQLDATPGYQTEGVGLGLAIVKELLDLMGADLQVHSTVGQGSTFSFGLALDSTEPPASRGPRKIEAGTLAAYPRKLMIVEDNAINRSLYEAYLDALGLAYTSTTDGDEAIRSCEDDQYDMIFMDINLPTVSGLDATRAIREISDHYAGVPIIAMTANAFVEDIRRCKDAGMNDHLAKPFKLEDLHQTIAKNYSPAG
ncbi:MAG: hypothetical protein Alpg2KO_10630 [Alphaproteobacteria bacterium]